MPPFIKIFWHISIFVNYLRSSLTFDISMVCKISHYTGLYHNETWLYSVYIWVPVYMGADTGHPTDSLGPDRSAAGWVLNFQVNMYISTFLGYQQFYMFLLTIWHQPKFHMRSQEKSHTILSVKKQQFKCVCWRPGHTALYGLIMAKTRQKMVYHEADDFVCVDVEFKTSYTQFIDVAGCRKKFRTASNTATSFELLNILARRQPRVAHVVKTCNTRKTHMIIHVLAVIKTWGDAVRRKSLGVCHRQRTVIGRVLCVCITGNNVCLAAYHWQMDFSVLRQCFSSGTAADGHTPYKARPSQNSPKITIMTTSSRFS